MYWCRTTVCSTLSCTRRICTAILHRRAQYTIHMGKTNGTQISDKVKTAVEVVGVRVLLLKTKSSPIYFPKMDYCWELLWFHHRSLSRRLKLQTTQHWNPQKSTGCFLCGQLNVPKMQFSVFFSITKIHQSTHTPSTVPFAARYSSNTSFVTLNHARNHKQAEVSPCPHSGGR